MIVATLMEENIACVRPNQPLSDAARLMWDCDCGALPVVNDNGEVCAMITDRDICMATWLRGSAPTALTVSSAMSRQLYHCSPFDTVSSAEALMRAKQVRRLPVLDGEGALLGVLSLADIAKATALAASTDLDPGKLTLTLASICQPWQGEAQRSN